MTRGLLALAAGGLAYVSFESDIRWMATLFAVLAGYLFSAMKFRGW